MMVAQTRTVAMGIKRKEGIWGLVSKTDLLQTVFLTVMNNTTKLTSLKELRF